MVLPGLHPVQILFNKTKFVTPYMVSFLDCHSIEKDLPQPKDLSYPARSLLASLNSLHYDGEIPFEDVWSLATLRNIVLSDRDNMEEDLGKDLSETFYWKLHEMDANTFLDYIFGHPPTRKDLLTHIEIMLENENESSDIGQEHPLAMLMNGLFTSPGNVKCLADEDWQLLAQAVGLSPEASHDKITRLLIDNQNQAANEIITKGYDETVRGISMTSSIIDIKYTC